jgi:hypothetical protein
MLLVEQLESRRFLAYTLSGDANRDRTVNINDCTRRLKPRQRTAWQQLHSVQTIHASKRPARHDWLRTRLSGKSSGAGSPVLRRVRSKTQSSG